MNDGALIALLISTLQTGLTARSITVGVKQAFQPTQQGAPSAPYILLRKLGDARYGSPACSDVYDTVAGAMSHTEKEVILSNYQIGASAIQDATITRQLSVADYLKAAAAVLQSQAAIVALAANGVGIDRITALKQTYFIDEKGRNEASPIFEFTVNHVDSFTSVIPSTADLVPNVATV